MRRKRQSPSQTRFPRLPLLCLAAFAVSLLLQGLPANAAPVSEENARQAVGQWLALDGSPFGATLGTGIKAVQSVRDAWGLPLYYLVTLDPQGIVVVAGDDRVEPIAAFAASGEVAPPPFRALLAGDIAGRVRAVRRGGRAALSRQAADSSAKWRRLLGDGKGTEPREHISDVRVPHLVNSEWGQGNVYARPCYNYYTPKNYPCGCVATALAELMRSHRYPQEGIGQRTFTITVDGAEQQAVTRGGDGEGGPYDWGEMVSRPGVLTMDGPRRAIGAITYDAGLSVGMQYTGETSLSYIKTAAEALQETFGYGNAVFGYNQNESIPGERLQTMINPSLDAGYPVILGINDTTGAEPEGHAILADGYGYNLGTLYHHLNMGWEGSYSIWYNLPGISGPVFAYDSITKAVYNIFPGKSGEILSGRVTGGAGNPLSDVALHLSGDALQAQHTTSTDERGIYAFAGIPASADYTVTAEYGDAVFTPASRDAATGRSATSRSTTGNIWQVDFQADVTATPVPKGSGGGGCTTGIAPLALLLLAPLLVPLRKYR